MSESTREPASDKLPLGRRQIEKAIAREEDRLYTQADRVVGMVEAAKKALDRIADQAKDVLGTASRLADYRDMLLRADEKERAGTSPDSSAATKAVGNGETKKKATKKPKGDGRLKKRKTKESATVVATEDGGAYDTGGGKEDS